MDGSASAGEVTRLLRAAREGDDAALGRIIPVIYDDLRRVAEGWLRREGPGHTLGATEVVHESYLRMLGGAAHVATDRAHFMALAARTMRQVLVDHARRTMAAKRGGGARPGTLPEDAPASVGLSPEDLIALDEAMASLEPRQREVVECRFFGGMEEADVALALGVSDRTVRRDWVKARAWLYSILYPEPEEFARP